MLPRLFILLALSTACSPDLDLDKGERVKSAESKSPFQSECVLANGSIACKVKYEDNYIKLDHPELELTPTFAAYQFSDISIISPSDLDIKDSFLSLKSPIEKKSEYTLVLSFLDEVSVFDFFDKVAPDDISQSENSGIVVLPPKEQYVPEPESRLVEIDHCMIGHMLRSWLIGKDASNDFPTSSFSDQDFRYKTIIPINETMSSVEKMSLSNTEKWERIFNDLSENYINSSPSCSNSNYDYPQPDTLDFMEKFSASLNNFLESYLIRFNKKTKEELVVAKPLEK